MKPSPRLLLALAALIAALAMLFWPRSAAATAPPLSLAPSLAHNPASENSADDPFEKRCVAMMVPSIQVSATAPSFVVNTSVSTRVLRTLGHYASASQSVMGMTASHTLADISIDGAAILDSSGTRECIAPRIEVLLSFSPLDVYVAREFSPRSCAYSAVLKHEMQHVKIYTDELNRIERLVHAELVRRYGSRPLIGAPGTGLPALQTQINSWLEPLMRQQMAGVERLQAQLDTVEETEKLSHACLGEVAAMMGSSF